MAFDPIDRSQVPSYPFPEKVPTFLAIAIMNGFVNNRLVLTGHSEPSLGRVGGMLRSLRSLLSAILHRGRRSRDLNSTKSPSKSWHGGLSSNIPKGSLSLIPFSFSPPPLPLHLRLTLTAFQMAPSSVCPWSQRGPTIGPSSMIRR